MLKPKLGGSVCLSNRTTKSTDKQADEKEARLPNSVYVAIAGEVVNRRSVFLKSFVLKGQESASNPLLHIHPKRCMPCEKEKPSLIWHIYKATQANPQTKLYKRAKSPTLREFKYLPVF